jgi:hypothetical protein
MWTGAQEFCTIRALANNIRKLFVLAHASNSRSCLSDVFGGNVEALRHAASHLPAAYLAGIVRIAFTTSVEAFIKIGSL